MGEKDITEKILEDHNDVFADIINGLIFAGEQRILPESLENTAVHSQYKADDEKVHELERDVAKYWKDQDVQLAICGIENQSSVEKYMPFRIIGYDGTAYRSQLQDKRKEILPVMTIVLYFGTEHRWYGKRNIKGLMKIPEGLDDYINDYKMQVFEVAWLTEEQISRFRSDFKIVANFFVQKRKNKDYIPDDPTEIKHIDEVLKLLQVMTGDSNNELVIAYHQEEKEILSRMPELPFSNIWIASVTAKKLPADSVLHLGIRNSLRSWNYFDTQETVTGYSNTGGFGIDGSLSTVIGAALCHPDRLYYCVLGDLAFFYDMNALGNRHVPSNIRILVVNNGLGFEMKFPASWGYSIANSIGVSEDNYVCAAGHYSSPDLIKSYVYGLGFEYLKVSTKDQYFDCLPKIVSNEKQDRTLVVEIVVNSENEDAALNLIGSIMVDESNAAKAAIKKAIGKKGIDAIKKMMGR